MKRFTLTILTMGLLFLSCKKSHISPEKYFIFGISYGECIDDCATFYLISKGKLYPDSVQYRSNSTELQFKSMALSNEKYLQAKKLMDNFPTYLKKTLIRHWAARIATIKVLFTLNSMKMEIVEHGILIRQTIRMRSKNLFRN